METIEDQVAARMAVGTQNRTAEIRIAAMDCAACEIAITESLRRLDGVQAVVVDWRVGVARVTYDHGRGDERLIRHRIEELGFAVRPDGGHDVPIQRGTSLLRLSLLSGILVLLPFLFLFRDRLAYMPGQDSAFVPAGLRQETFSVVSAIAVAVAFLTGVATFFSPSIVAMVSVVLSYTAGTARRHRGEALRVTAGFAVGLVLIDIVVGAAYGGLGKAAIRFFSGRLAAWDLLIALVLVATGLAMLRVWRVPGLRFGGSLWDVQGFRGALMLSAPFGLVDCPGCNPLLLPIALGIAATGSPVFGAIVMGAFGLGRGLLLMAAGASAGTAKQWQSMTRWLPVVETAGGWMLLLAGLYFFKEFLRLVEIPNL